MDISVLDALDTSGLEVIFGGIVGFAQGLFLNVPLVMWLFRIIFLFYSIKAAGLRDALLYYRVSCV